MKREMFFGIRQSLCVIALFSLLVTLLFGQICLAVENENVQHYKMLSSVEYSGKGQFKNQVESLFTARKQFLSDDNIRYFISSKDFDLIEGNLITAQQPSPKEISFVINERTRHISGSSKDLEFLEKINNHCVGSLTKVTKDNIGKTWQQSFSMPFLDHLLAGEVTFTLTAIQLKTKAFGPMVAVRALSEPFVVKAATANGTAGNIKSTIGAVYLFDPEFKDVYLSISVYEASTDINGSKEKLRHEVATYKTDVAGKSVDLSGLGKDFEKLVTKIGLTRETLKVVKESPLPQWAQYEGLTAGQVSHICAATACEGALNPVAMVCIPVARTVALQSRGALYTADRIGAVSRALASRVSGIGTLKIAAGPLIMGVSPTTAGLIAGGGTAIAAGAGGGGGGDGARSPSTP